MNYEFLFGSLTYIANINQCAMSGRQQNACTNIHKIDLKCRHLQSIGISRKVFYGTDTVLTYEYFGRFSLCQQHNSYDYQTRWNKCSILV